MNTIDLTNINGEYERRIQEAKEHIAPKALFTIDDVFNTLVYARSIYKVDINPYDLTKG